VCERPPRASSYHLLELKNKGGLVVPSEGIVRVVQCAEKGLRALSAQKPGLLTCDLRDLSRYVRSAIGFADVFSLGEHIAKAQDHHFQLINQIVSVYHKIRMHHVMRLKNDELLAGSCRKSSIKKILFQGYLNKKFHVKF
jgi:hypothetical protein